MATLIPIAETGGLRRTRAPLRRLGFRPFYLGAALAAVALVCAAGIAWIAAFMLTLWRFAPWLVAARIDGKDG